MTSLPRHYRALPPVPATADSAPDLSILSSTILTWDSSKFHDHLNTLPIDEPTRKYLQMESIPQLVKSYSTSTGKQQLIAFSMLHRILDWLDDPVILNSLISRHSASSDSRYRLLAVALLPFATDPVRLRNSIIPLTLDRVPAVRCALIETLPRIKADPKVIESIVRNAAHDKHHEVRRAAAKVIVSITSHLSVEYGLFLKQPETAEIALPQFSEMVELHGFRAFSEEFKCAIHQMPDLAATALLKAVQLLKVEEEDVLLEWAEELSINRVFLQGLFTFSEYFTDRRQFLTFIDGKRSSQWRVRSVMIEQAILFVDLFGEELVEKAVQFAEDEVAMIRNLAVLLWVELIRKDVKRIGKMMGLIDGGWHARMVAAKIVGRMGVIPELEQIAEKLSTDPIGNIRYCLAVGIKGTDSYKKLFSRSDDRSQWNVGRIC
jgi:HEAT repeat protein